MRLRQIICFVRVCELGSISRAAAELNIAQPALGLQIRGLEHEFGTELMVRSSRGVTPTEAGELVLEYSRTIVRQDRELRNKLKELRHDKPTAVKLAMTASLIHLIAGAVIEEARDQLPNVHLEVIEGASELVAGWVEDERVDIGLAFGSFPTRSVEELPLLIERLYYLSAPGARYETITLAEVLSMPLALPNEQNSIRHTVENAARSLDMAVVGQYEIASLHASRAIARRGIAGVIAPYGGIAADHQRGELSVRMIVEPMLERTLFLMRRADRSVSPIEERLTAIVRETLFRETGEKTPAGAYVTIERD